MFEKILVDETKSVSGRQYAYEIKSLTLNQIDDETDITIEPFNAAAAEKIAGLFRMYFRIIGLEPERQNKSTVTIDANGNKYVIKGDKQALEEAIRFLSQNSFISMNISRKVIDRLNTDKLVDSRPSGEHTPLLRKISAK